MRTQVLPALRRLRGDSAYLLLGFPVAVIGFCLLVPLFAAGVGTIVIWVGLPLLVGCLLLARVFADVQRLWLPGVLGRDVARPRYPGPPEGAGPIRRLLHPLTVGQAWLDLLHGIVILPVSIVTFVLCVSWWAVTLGGLTYPLYGWIASSVPGNVELPELLGLGDNFLVHAAFYMSGGAVFGLLLYPMVRGSAMAQALLGRALLTGVAELQERIADLTEGRAAAVSAEANALRRLERDIHDGPQQRLVHLAMELSRAQRQVSKDPDAASATLKQAIAATRETLDELRALSRGIAPPILSDRGLAPALAALAGRCTVPVELDVQTAERYPAALENAIYFVTAEALTNVAKHSRARLCTVTLSRTGDVLLLTIGDDGVGGAHVAKGHGLSGLADRLRAVDGELVVQSPPGGPTMIVAEVPCA
ncbi:sensor domain-containing protein [Thermopolyspora sp. NPDC052614]|uniref:sensor histidine kinase n=1 Tax=Thermopolyspora sp. NPDC052614 TaxID=3155682 RepID=UPI0034398BAE